MGIVRFYSLNAFNDAKFKAILENLKKNYPSISGLSTEVCYHIETCKGSKLTENDEKVLRWILKEPQMEDSLTKESQLQSIDDDTQMLIEIGPRFNFSTADSTNSVSICHSAHITCVTRVEKSIRYLVSFTNALHNSAAQHLNDGIVALLSDRMTQCQYTEKNMPRESFNEQLPKKNLNESDWFFVPVLSEGRSALEKVNNELGLAFDNWDLDYYTNLFQNTLKRDPTSVELFDFAQSNSEHSRHWFFRGKMIVDGVEQEKSLIRMIIDTQEHTNLNNTIKFSDNSSAIKGFTHKTLVPGSFKGPAKVDVKEVESDLIFTAETHNMPTAVAPFSGATTGTGGRIRDVQGVGRGGLTIAGTAGYCVGSLNIPGYDLPDDLKSVEYPPSFEKPLKIIIEASNGASDYGNKFGEPVLSGFAISYGIINAEGKRDEYVKPIMFSGGLGTMLSSQVNKNDPQKGMLLAKIGGPVYRIGVGGGAASSVEVQGDNSSELDFNAVQRGDAEMENKLNRVVRACIELGDKNPIQAIHDQGAGGNGNVLKELVEPGYAGAVIFTKEFQLGDPTITALELWGAEYQENNAILCKPEDRKVLEEICARERCPISFVGFVTGEGFVTLIEGPTDAEKYAKRENRESWGDLPFDMHLKEVLGEMPKKEFQLNHTEQTFKPLELPAFGDTYNEALLNVLSLMTVGSKRFLTNKVDRCVTGLVAQQQCVGPLHTPLADCAITAVSHFTHQGIATSIGTQPIKGILSAAAGARMSVAEALSNLVFAGITELPDVKCSGNWMWAAKLPGEGAKLFDACKAMCDVMKILQIAVDGGKDSLSMAARIKDETIKSPGTLVISTYAPCPDVRVKVTPDLKSPQNFKKGELVWVNIESKFRLGGSALAQAFKQQGNDTPDIANPMILRNAFNATQNLLKDGKLLAGHDISDGGLVTCLIEMAIAGLCGIEVDLTSAMNSFEDSAFNGKDPVLQVLFAEEAGWVLETDTENLEEVLEEFKKKNVPAYHIGRSIGLGLNSQIQIKSNGRILIDIDALSAYKQWERTSYELEKLQMNPECAEEEYTSLDFRSGPKYACTFNPDQEIIYKQMSSPIVVACIREEGTNGDREMIASLITAKFEVHDVTMQDLLQGKTTLDRYRGVIFPGGFSYADTLGSAKGWAASVMCNEKIASQFRHFKARKDTFSLGVCNGCQLMSLIGWVGEDLDECDDAKKTNGVSEMNGHHSELDLIKDVPNVALLHNKSGRFECRWSCVKIPKSNAIMLKRMEGSVLGCWIAHGEGRFSFKSSDVLSKLKKSNLITLQYVDDYQQPTEVYPMNPNGSVEGIAGICSADGRHLAMMPHPERCTQMWQWPYVTNNFNFEKCPWQFMFDEAYLWCCDN
uniref:Phosphoribosylformylglycinamidine synthase n=1 Tax=Culicoides sonorensis TaxID=179676 RepID=A0A336M968_CULSO